MLGAIIGDIVGSRFEWNNIKTKEFEFFTYKCEVTDDSIMSLAVAQVLLNCKGDYDSLGAAAVCIYLGSRDDMMRAATLTADDDFENSLIQHE